MPTGDRGGPAPLKRAVKRNRWVVIGFFGLVVVSWLNSLLGNLP